MMDTSFASTFNNSRRIFDKSQSILNQSFEASTIFSEYSTLADYNLNSNINCIYNGFKEITKGCSESNNYLKMVDDFNQTLSEYSSSLKKNLNMFSKSNTELSNVSNIINNEIQTWKLIYLLYEDRFKEKSNERTKNIIKSNVSHSELEVLRKLYQSNKDLREAQIVIDWLEYYMKEKVNNNTEFLIGSHGKSWEQTKYFINKGGVFTMSKGKIAYNLDPDAPLRGKLMIGAHDKTNEDEYLRYLYHCVQSGDIDKAKQVCQNHDELWRAQTLEGWKPFHNPLIKEDYSDIIHHDIYGNPNRSIFKIACQKLSENTDLNIYERAIYATFCGNLQVLSMIEKDWSGLLWAHFKVYIELTIEKDLKASTDTGLFNTQSLFGEDDLNLDQFQIFHNTSTGTTNDINNNLNLEDIFDEISLALVHDPIDLVRKGFSSDQKPNLSSYQSIFEMVQQFVILEDIIGLIQQIQFVVLSFPEKKTLSDKNTIRFLAHLIIFIYSIHDNLDISMYHSVLEEYIKCLLEDKWLDNVAFYISKLSTDLQIKWYCQCLMGVTNYQERKKCVEDGMEYDLPIVEITRLLVEYYRINEDKLDNVPSTGFDTNFDDRYGVAMFITDNDKANIDSLDWLSFLPEQQCHLIRQINAFSRSFIEMDKLCAAKMTMNKMTDSTWSQLNINVSKGPKWLASALYENECLRKYIECHDLYGNWYNHFTCHKPIDIDPIATNIDVNKMSFQEKQDHQKKYDDYIIEYQKWEKSVHFNAQRAFDCFLSMLKMGPLGWLSDFGDDSLWLENEVKVHERDNDTCYHRKEQLECLRRKCIVSIVFMAMNMMANSGLQDKCFSMTDLIADNQYQLFSVFDKKHLQKMLQKIKQCSLQLMSEGRNALVI